MKTKSPIFLLTVVTVCGLGIAAVAQEAAHEKSTSRKGAAQSESSSAASHQQMPDGLVKHEGVVKFIKNGQAQKVDKEMKLSEGITVQPNGDVELKDGTRMTLQEGQMVTLDSQVTTIPPAAMKSLKKGEEGRMPGKPLPEGRSNAPSGID